MHLNWEFLLIWEVNYLFISYMDDELLETFGAHIIKNDVAEHKMAF